MAKSRRPEDVRNTGCSCRSLVYNEDPYRDPSFVIKHSREDFNHDDKAVIFFIFLISSNLV